MGKRRGSRGSRGQINAGVPAGSQQPSRSKLEQQAENVRLACVEWMDETEARIERTKQAIADRVRKRLEQQATARKSQNRVLTPEEKRAERVKRHHRRKAIAKSTPPRRETCVVETGSKFQTVCNGNMRGTGAAYTLEPHPEQPEVLVETRVGQVAVGFQEMEQSIQDVRYAYHLKRQLASKINGVPRDEFLELARANQPEPSHIPVMEKKTTGRTISAAALGVALSSLPAPR